jgi:iron complex outermembrane receptor protein
MLSKSPRRVSRVRGDLNPQQRSKPILYIGQRTLAAMLAAMVTSAAFAQEVERSGTIAEVIVTAQKREQNLLDVAGSISVVSGVTLGESGVVGIQELAQMVPGLLFSETIGRQTTNPAIRGIAPVGFADPTVQILVDGFTNGFGRSNNNVSLLDLERVEVMRGPQPTLYGRNALGGVINYITRPPGDTLQSRVFAEVGTYESRVIQGSISGPIVDGKFFAGAAAGLRQSGGFMDNVVGGAKDVNDEEDVNARLRLRFTPTESLTIDLTVDHNRADDAAGDPSHVPPAFYSASPPSLADVAAGAVDFNDFSRTVQHDVLGGFDRKATTTVLNLSYDLGWAELVSIAGYSDQWTDIQTDVTRTPGPSLLGDYFNVIIDLDSFSEELRLVSRSDGAFQWLLGAYYFESETDSLTTFNDQIPPFGGHSLAKSWNSAVFFNADYALTERFTLSGGLRYDAEKRRSTNLLTGVRTQVDFEEVLPSISLKFKVNDGLNVYGLVSRGYHAGGANSPLAVAAGAPPAYESEFLTNYELGLKAVSPRGVWSLESAVFYMDWVDQQVSNALSSLLSYVTNAGKSRVKGLEISGNLLATPELTLSASVSLLDAEFTDYYAPLSAGPFGLDPQLAGNKMVFAADVMASGSAQYRRPLGAEGWELRLRGDVSYVGERPFDVTNLLMADAYTIVNLYAGMSKGPYEIGVFADNAFDEDYLTGGILPSVFFPPLLTVGDPRVVGVRVAVQF